MTLLVTMATNRAIVMGADSKISMWDSRTNKFVDPQSLDAIKIVPMEQYHMAASFWGLLDIHAKCAERIVRKNLIEDIFQDFIISLSPNDNVDSVSEKFRDYVNETTDLSKLKDFIFGVHMAGYVEKEGRKEPKVRHVCLSPDDDKDPSQKDPAKFKSNDESAYCPEPPYAMVFNGFYYIVNALVNWVRQNYGDIYSLFNPKKMTMDQAVSFTKYLINITKGFQRYARAPALVGGTVRILTIDSKKQYNWHNH